jgi:probable phosphoglycerate mutase
MPEFIDAFPAEAATWVAGAGMPTLEGAESTADVEERLVPALRECLSALQPGETGVVITHGASLKVGLAGLLGWPQQVGASLRGMDNCGWALLAELHDGGRLRLEAYNRTAGPAAGGLTDL